MLFDVFFLVNNSKWNANLKHKLELLFYRKRSKIMFTSALKRFWMLLNVSVGVSGQLQLIKNQVKDPRYKNGLRDKRLIAKPNKKRMTIKFYSTNRTANEQQIIIGWVQQKKVSCDHQQGIYHKFKSKHRCTICVIAFAVGFWLTSSLNSSWWQNDQSFQEFFFHLKPFNMASLES